ncbi:MAG: hypothetical protein ACETV0_03585 [Nitrososphaeria archaeon]
MDELVHVSPNDERSIFQSSPHLPTQEKALPAVAAWHGFQFTVPTV